MMKIFINTDFPLIKKYVLNHAYSFIGHMQRKTLYQRFQYEDNKKE